MMFMLVCLPSLVWDRRTGSWVMLPFPGPLAASTLCLGIFTGSWEVRVSESLTVLGLGA